MRSIKNMGKLGDSKADGMDIASLRQKYEGKSESELMQELFKKVAAAKSDGSFSPEQLDDFVRFMSPNLDEQSLKRLTELVGMIKGE